MAHQKHAKLTKPDGGTFGRLELGVLGAPCSEIKKLTGQLIEKLKSYNLSYLDADHHAPESAEFNSLKFGAQTQLTNKISHYELISRDGHNHFFNEADLVFINGNHFKADQQIAWIHPKKSLEKKLEKLTNVGLVLLEEGEEIPEFLKVHLEDQEYEVIQRSALNEISSFVERTIKANIPKLNGLVLIGGKSTRMQKDKSKLVIRDNKPQFEYLSGLLKKHCDQVFVSARDEEQAREYNLPAISDKFIGLGPYGGILSALMEDPNAAWFVVAVDLPFLTDAAIQKLVNERNPGKVATCYIDRHNEFPEPLITIWEPKAYPLLLNFLSRGYSCPRKVLINTDVNIITDRDESILTNVNNPDELSKAKSLLS